jgi:hypothetical protein
MRIVAVGVLFVVPALAQTPVAERRPDAAALYALAIEEAQKAFGGDALAASWNPVPDGDDPEQWRFVSPEWRAATARGGRAILLFEQAASISECSFETTEAGLSSYEDRATPLFHLAMLVAARAWQISADRPRDAGEAGFRLLRHSRHVARHARGVAPAMVCETVALTLLRETVARVGPKAPEGRRDPAFVEACRREFQLHASNRPSLARIAEIHLAEIERVLKVHLADDHEIRDLVKPESRPAIHTQAMALAEEAFAPLRSASVPVPSRLGEQFRAFVERLKKDSSLEDARRAVGEGASASAARDVESRIARQLVLLLLPSVPAIVEEDLAVRQLLDECRERVAERR